MPPALVGFNMPLNGYKRDAKGRAKGWQKKGGGVLALERNDSGRRSEDRKKKEKCFCFV